MKRIGKHFADELRTAGLFDGVAWGEDGSITFTDATQEHKAAVLALVEAHDPETPPIDWWLDNELRPERDRRLAASDWTQMPDSPLTTEQKQAWAAYRKSLRDLPAAVKAPTASIPWPAEPGP